MSGVFDVVVLGGGPAGEHCAARLAAGGRRVAIVERELLGGECSYWGCIPSKTLVRPGEALQAARDVPGAARAVDGRGVELGQAVRRMGAEVAIVEGAERLLAREPAALGDALSEALRADGVELHLGRHAASAAHVDGEYVLELTDGTVLRGDRLLVATGRRPRTEGLGLETVGLAPGRGGIAVDARMRAAEGVWAIGDVTGIWPLTYVGKYQGRVAAANILGHHREADYTAVPRVVFTDPQIAAVGDADGAVAATVPLAEVARTATYTRAYDTRPGFLTLVSDGERLTGAHAVGPEAGEWLQQATVAIRTGVPLAVLLDVIQPFPTFSEAFLHALLELEARVPAPV